jgi:hypothetical protein
VVVVRGIRVVPGRRAIVALLLVLLVLRLRRGVVKGPPAAPVRIMPARRRLRRPVRRPTSIVAAPTPAPAPAPPATAVLMWVRGLWLIPAIVRFLIPAAAPTPTIIVRARRVFAAPPARVAHVHLMARVHRDLPKCPLTETPQAGAVCSTPSVGTMSSTMSREG